VQKRAESIVSSTTSQPKCAPLNTAKKFIDKTGRERKKVEESKRVIERNIKKSV
jgi:hypothetical protein